MFGAGIGLKTPLKLMRCEGFSYRFRTPGAMAKAVAGRRVEALLKSVLSEDICCFAHEVGS